MFHFKLISATDISKHKITSYVYIIPKRADGVDSDDPYAITQTISKQKDPQYNEEIALPFYCFKAIDLLFWVKKIGKTTTFASALIPLTLDTFLKHQPQSIPLKLFEPIKNANPTVEFSISYLPYINLNIKQVINPSKIYAYLTYDPPLQPNTQEVYLMCRGVDNNGTIYDPSKNFQRTEETELKKCGPTGLTEVYYIDHEKIVEDKYFFYIKSIGYTGKVTLNLATSPEKVKCENHNEYALLDNGSSVLVNSSSTTLALFPVKLLFSCESVSISIAQISPQIGFRNVVLPADYKPPQPSGDVFVDLTNYITNDPNGIAEMSLIETGCEMVKFDSNECVKSYRFEVTAGNRYSLSNAFKYNSVTNPPKELLLTFVMRENIPLEYFMFSCNRGGGEMKCLKPGTCDSIWYLNEENVRGVSPNEFYFGVSLGKIDSSAKFVGFFATSRETSGVKNRHGGYVLCLTWEQEAACRIVDKETRKEVMCLHVERQMSPAGVLLLMLVRGEKKDEWEVWPCAKFFKPRIPYGINVIGEKDCSEFFAKFIANEEVYKMFKV